MAPRRSRNVLSMVGLIVLAVVATGLSAAALLQNQTAIPTPPAPSTVASSGVSASPTPMETVPQSGLPSVTESTSEDSVPVGDNGSKVTILGDIYSKADTSNLWVPKVAASLGWASVSNFSENGRGYIASPSTCDVSACSNFAGTIPAVVAEDPDVVVTFGGMADGDQDLSDAAAQYFTALRSALPDAELIAVSPVTSEQPAPYFLVLHDQTIRAAVEAVDGTFIDAERPGVGDGDELSSEAQDKIAEAVIAALS